MAHLIGRRAAAMIEGERLIDSQPTIVR